MSSPSTSGLGAQSRGLDGRSLPGRRQPQTFLCMPADTGRMQGKQQPHSIQQAGRRQSRAVSWSAVDSSETASRRLRRCSSQQQRQQQHPASQRKASVVNHACGRSLCTEISLRTHHDDGGTTQRSMLDACAVCVALLTSDFACRQEPAASTESGDDDDEPEAAVLLIACGIGLLTGSGVVLFNVAIHAIQASHCRRRTTLTSCVRRPGCRRFLADRLSEQGAGRQAGAKAHRRGRETRCCCAGRGVGRRSAVARRHLGAPPAEGRPVAACRAASHPRCAFPQSALRSASQSINHPHLIAARRSSTLLTIAPSKNGPAATCKHTTTLHATE